MKKNYHKHANRLFVQKYHLRDLKPPNFNKLINDKIFEEIIPSNRSKSKIIREDSTSFDKTIRFNTKEYCLNPALPKEIFDSMEFLVEELNTINYEDYNVIENQIYARYTNEEKIQFLVEKRKELYLIIQNDYEFPLFLGLRKTDDYDNWQDYIYSYFLWNNDFIIKYLTEDINIDDFPKGLFYLWHKFYKTKKLVEFCENKINELARKKTDDSIEKIEGLKTLDDNSNDKATNNPLSNIIFKEDGLEIFNFIVSKYPKLKTKAFFSYLFFFIKKINKSNIEGNDSVDYRTYILTEFGIEFPRIIYSISEKQSAKEKINILFEKYLIEYKILNVNEK